MTLKVGNLLCTRKKGVLKFRPRMNEVNEGDVGVVIGFKFDSTFNGRDDYTFRDRDAIVMWNDVVSFVNVAWATKNLKVVL